MLDILNYRKNSRFINDLDSLFANLDDDISITEKIEILKKISDYNNNVYNEVSKENKEYLDILARRENGIYSKNNKIEKINEQISLDGIVDDKSLKLDISFYIDFINSIDNVEELTDVLPLKITENYENIINLILVNLLKEEVIIKVLLKDIDKDDKDYNYYIEEYNRVHNKINYIKNYLKVLNESPNTIKEKKENNIVFLNTGSGNNCFLNDLKSIDNHYYTGFIELLESIKNSTFKNVKNFVDNKQLLGLSEVKGYQVRVIFKRLNNNTYCVLQALVKKQDNDQYYRDMLVSRYGLYKAQESRLLELVNNEDYLKQNAEEYNCVIDYMIDNQKGGQKCKNYLS